MDNLLITDLNDNCLSIPPINEEEMFSEDFYGYSLSSLDRPFSFKKGDMIIPKMAIEVLGDYIKASKIDLDDIKYTALDQALKSYASIVSRPGSTIYFPNMYEDEKGHSKSGMNLNLYMARSDFNGYVENIDLFYSMYLELKKQIAIIEQRAMEIPELERVKIKGYDIMEPEVRCIYNICKELRINERIEEKVSKWRNMFERVDGTFGNIRVLEYPQLLEDSLRKLLEQKNLNQSERSFVLGQYIDATQEFSYLSKSLNIDKNYDKEYGATFDVTKAVAVFHDKDFALEALSNVTGHFNGDLCLLEYKNGVLLRIYNGGPDIMGEDKLSTRLDEFNALIEKLKLQKGISKIEIKNKNQSLKKI